MASSPGPVMALAAGSGPASASLELEHLGVRQSRFATFIDYRVKK
jgi:hypothetical protein